MSSKKSKLALLVFGVLLGFFLFTSLSRSKPGKNMTSILSSPTPMSFPLQELTIPYLRTRTYKGELNEFKELSSSGSYTSYLTSYVSDGLKINALLTRPTGDLPTGGWPAIVFVHGYIAPTTYQTDGVQYADYVDYLASHGFVVFKIDLRGHGDSEGQPGGGYFGADYIADTLNASDALGKSGFVNPDKIGLWGHSMAGNVLMRSFAIRPDIPAVVIWAGAVYSYADMQKYGIQDNSYRPPVSTTPGQSRRQRITELYGQYDDTIPFWQQMAPTNFVNDLKGALEIHHAVDDVVVNIGYSRDLMTAMKSVSAPHELFEYPTGGHNLSGASFDLAMQRTVAFFKKYLN